MITKKQVKHIAKLARLGLTTAEIEKFQKDLSSILDYFEKLKKVDISKVKPTSHSIEIENVLREDEAKKEAEEKRKEKLLELAPDKKDRYLKVKPIL